MNSTRMMTVKTKLTIQDIKSKIVSEEFWNTGTLTVCVLTLQNGTKVTGESACIDPANFDAQVGKNIARDNAIDKIWALEGYLLKQKLFEAE